MSDYAWFALKGIGYLALVGVAVWILHSAWPLLVILFMPGWSSDTCKCSAAGKSGE